MVDPYFHGWPPEPPAGSPTKDAISAVTTLSNARRMALLEMERSRGERGKRLICDFKFLFSQKRIRDYYVVV
jgi:hypothetical protein